MVWYYTCGDCTHDIATISFTVNSLLNYIDRISAENKLMSLRFGVGYTCTDVSVIIVCDIIQGNWV